MRELLRLSMLIGARAPYWTQAGGGNLSVKIEDGLWIKPSGLRLDALKQTSDFISAPLRVSRATLLDLLNGRDVESAAFAYDELLRESTDARGRRLSMEAGLHLALEGTFVLHFHSLVALLIAHESRADGARVARWFRERAAGYGVAFVPPVAPGLELARAVRAAGAAQIYVLENHGVVLQTRTRADAAEAAELVRVWENLELDFCATWAYGAERETPASAPLRIYFPDVAIDLQRLQHALVPTNVAGEYRLRADLAHDPGLSEIWQAICKLYHLQPGLRELEADLAAQILNMPAERYRQSVLSPTPGKGRKVG